MIYCITIKIRKYINKEGIGSLEWKTAVTRWLDGFQPVLSFSY